MRPLTLDDAGTEGGALSDPTGFVGGLGGPVVIEDVVLESNDGSIAPASGRVRGARDDWLWTAPLSALWQ